MPWHHQILTDQLSLSQPGETYYAHHVTTGPPGFSDPPTALLLNYPILKYLPNQRGCSLIFFQKKIPLCLRIVRVTNDKSVYFLNWW